MPRLRWFARLVFTAVIVSSAEAAAQPRQRQVLALYSVRPDATVVTIGERELPKLLSAGISGTLDYYSEFLDQARYAERYDQVFREYLAQKYADHQLDLVLAMDHDALAFVAKHRTDLFDDVPIVFFSSRPSPPHLPMSTGVNAVINLRETLALARALQPDLRNVFVVTGADRSYEVLARAELESFESQLSVTYLSALATSELERRLANLPPRSMVFYVHVTRDNANANFNAIDYLDRVSAIANAPTYSWVDSAMGHGIVGGSLRSLEAQMTAVAGVAVRVLSGEPADTIPVELANLNVQQVDWRQLRRWGIDEDRVPPGTTMLFREPTAWEQYRGYIVAGGAGLVVQALLIAGLLVERRMRRLAETLLRGKHAALRASHHRIRDLGARLLHAQEKERSRIARELHDDICQRLVVLVWELDRLRERVQGPAQELADDIAVRVSEISANLSDVSHALHPAHLPLIGLVSAIDQLRDELSRAGVTVDFTHDRVPPDLRPEVALGLYRVVQEALQNVLRHGNVTRASVHLAGTPTQVILKVSDGGVGFDVRGPGAKGLGIISMRERIQGLGGSFEMRSAPGAGTRLFVRVPCQITESAAHRQWRTDKRRSHATA
jgi:signal transduction histidine kinase